LIQKGLERQLVIYWYQSDHRAEASEFRAKLQLMIGALRRHRTDSALVRISTPLAGGETGEPAEHFATAIFGTLDGLLP
jgi:EpsI family protein